MQGRNGRRFSVYSRGLATVAVIVSLIAVAFVGFPPANAAPPQPHNYFGVARDATPAPLPLGTRITAWVDGVDYSNGTSVLTAAGNYDMDVYGDNHTTAAEDNTPTIKTGADFGDETMFVAGDMTVYKPSHPQQVFTAKDLWGVGGPGQSESLDLTLAPANAQPDLPKIGRITTQPADGLTQYLYLCNPTTETIDASQYLLEKPVPGAFNGPTHPITGTLGPNGRLYVDLNSWSAGGTLLATTGDALKLVYNNLGTGFGGSRIIVDRVEYNQTFTATFVEPVNTIMTDAVAPGFGQEIRRVGANTCQDTNSNAVDFGLNAETGRPPPGTPPSIVVSTPSGGESWTGNTVHRIFWNQSDAEDPSLNISLDAGVDGSTWPIFITFGSYANGARFFDWLIPCTGPLGNSTTARVRGQAFDSTGANAISVTNTFEVDCSRPTLDNHTPGNGATSVDANTNVTLIFSEAMARGATEGAISFSPGPVPFSASWPTASTVVVNPTASLLSLTTYMVSVSCAATDDSSPGNQLAACPRDFSFTTALSDPGPMVDLTEPDGGESWTGGSTHTIFWNMSDNNPGSLPTTLEYSTNGGGSYTAIFTSTPRAQGPNFFAWTVPCPSTDFARVRVTATDSAPQSTSDASSTNFEIDCDAPTVLSTSPNTNAINVRVASPIIIIFSEDMEQATVTTGLFSIAPAVSGLVFTWTPPNADTLRIDHNDFETCTHYTVTIPGTAQDLSDPGNSMGASYSWSFDTACAPIVDVTAPTTADVFSCAPMQTLRFTVTDTGEPPGGSVFVWINWTNPPLLPPIDASSRPLGAQSVQFQVPAANITDARILVTAQDSTGQNGIDAAIFAIDCDAPSVDSSVPANAATNVAVSANFTITFSEAMNQTTMAAAISLNPSAGTLTFVWSFPRVLTVRHAALQTSTPYTLTVSSLAKDASRPGIGLDPEYTITFNTSATGAVVADAGGPYAAQAGASVTLDGSNSEAAAGIKNWTWAITAPGGAVSFAYGELSSVSFAAAGLYQIELTVTDNVDNTGTDTTTLQVTAVGGPNFIADYWWLFVILILAIVIALILVLGKRRKKEEAPMPPEVPPERVETMPPSRPPERQPAAAPPAAPAAKPPGAPMTRECPTCGTIVDTTDTECFMCGSKL